jgi:unsaturated rhamnogalacturonyl hydrolase
VAIEAELLECGWAVEEEAAGREFGADDVAFRLHAAYEELMGLGLGGGGDGGYREQGQATCDVAGHVCHSETGSTVILHVNGHGSTDNSLEHWQPTCKRGCLMLRFVVFSLAACASVLPAEDRYRENWISVADRLVTLPPETFAYNWGEGVQQIGLMRTYERTKDGKYLDWMRRWTALYEGKDTRELLNILEKPWGGEHAAYCGHWSPATAILLLHEAAPKARYLEIAEATAEFIAKQAERSPEGGLGHWKGSHQLWVDTLYMACPLLSELGRVRGRKDYVADSAAQIKIYAKHLQDRESGLFYHMWDWQTGQRTPGPWGRGNGWVTMSIADTMEAQGGGKDAELKKVLDGLMRGLEKTQDRDGLWHTVMDDASSYPECSATSMVVYGVLKLVRLGALPASKAEMAMKAWKAVNERYVKDGLVTGVSAGTVPKGREYYRKLRAGTETWGTGAYLLAGSEVDRR